MSNETVTETVTLAEAAKRLETNLPRLSRLIDRPQYADSVRREPRPTKTGIRTVTLISVSVLPALKAELQGKAEPDREQKQKQSHDELLASVQSEVAFLRGELVAQREARDKADSEFRRLLLSRDVEIGRLQERVQLLIEAPSTPSVPRVAVQDTAQDAQEGRSAKVETNADISALEVSPKPKKWFEFWRS